MPTYSRFLSNSGGGGEGARRVDVELSGGSDAGYVRCEDADVEAIIGVQVKSGTQRSATVRFSKLTNLQPKSRNRNRNIIRHSKLDSKDAN